MNLSSSLALSQRLTDHKVLHHKSLSHPLSLSDPCLAPLAGFCQGYNEINLHKSIWEKGNLFLGGGREGGGIPEESGLNVPGPVFCFVLTLSFPDRDFSASAGRYSLPICWRKHGASISTYLLTRHSALLCYLLQLFLRVRSVYQEGLRTPYKKEHLFSFCSSHGIS